MTKTLLVVLLVVFSFFSGYQGTDSLVLAYDPDTDTVECGDYEDPLLWHIVCPITRSINILVLSIGVALVAGIMVGSYKFATSIGDPRGVQGAYNTLTYVAMGFGVVVGVYVIFNILASIFMPSYSFGNLGDSLQDAIYEFVCNSGLANC